MRGLAGQIRVAKCRTQIWRANTEPRFEKFTLINARLVIGRIGSEGS